MAAYPPAPPQPAPPTGGVLFPSGFSAPPMAAAAAAAGANADILIGVPDAPALRAMPLPQAASSAFSTGLSILRTNPAGGYACFRAALALRAMGSATPWAEAMYNCACALSIAIEQYVASCHRVTPGLKSLADLASLPAGVAPDALPPLATAANTAREWVERRADEAIRWLGAAIGAGFNQRGTIDADADLSALREAAPGEYRRVTASCVAGGAAPFPTASSPFPSPQPPATLPSGGIDFPRPAVPGFPPTMPQPTLPTPDPTRPPYAPPYPSYPFPFQPRGFP